MEPTKTVYVGGFSNDTNAGSLHAAFVGFGDIVDLQLPPDPSHQKSHRGFAFVTFSSTTSALDAIDNMHRNVLPGPSNTGSVLKVNLAKAPKGMAVGGSNRAIWTDEAWLKEHSNPSGEPGAAAVEAAAEE